jgi:hypothetical protein
MVGMKQIAECDARQRELEICICDSKSAFRMAEHVDVSRAPFAPSADLTRHESP